MAVEQTLLELEEELWRANREGDGAFYDKTLRDDALLVSKHGMATKPQVVQTIQANRNPFIRTELSNHEVRLLSDTSAFVTYTVSYTALVNGEPQDFTALATSVYVLEAGEWHGVLHQQSAS